METPEEYSNRVGKEIESNKLLIKSFIKNFLRDREDEKIILPFSATDLYKSEIDLWGDPIEEKYRYNAIKPEKEIEIDAILDEWLAHKFDSYNFMD